MAYTFVIKKVENQFLKDIIAFYAINENPRPFAKEVIDKLKRERNSKIFSCYLL